MLLGAAPVQLCSPEQRFYWRHTWRPVHSSVEKHLFPSFDTNNAPKNILALVPCAHSTRLFSLLLYPSLIQTEQTVLSLCFRNSWFIEVGVYLGDSTLVYLRAFNLESGIFFFLFLQSKLRSLPPFTYWSWNIFVGKKSSFWRCS